MSARLSNAHEGPQVALALYFRPAVLALSSLAAENLARHFHLRRRHFPREGAAAACRSFVAALCRRQDAHPPVDEVNQCILSFSVDEMARGNA
jgi:hypothetical protein